VEYEDDDVKEPLYRCGIVKSIETEVAPVKLVMDGSILKEKNNFFYDLGNGPWTMCSPRVY
jgi:hypothetical protein